MYVRLKNHTEFLELLDLIDLENEIREKLLKGDDEYEDDYSMDGEFDGGQTGKRDYWDERNEAEDNVDGAGDYDIVDNQYDGQESVGYDYIGDHSQLRNPRFQRSVNKQHLFSSEKSRRKRDRGILINREKKHQKLDLINEEIRLKMKEMFEEFETPRMYFAKFPIHLEE